MIVYTSRMLTGWADPVVVGEVGWVVGVDCVVPPGGFCVWVEELPLPPVEDPVPSDVPELLTPVGNEGVDPPEATGTEETEVPLPVPEVGARATKGSLTLPGSGAGVIPEVTWAELFGAEVESWPVTCFVGTGTGRGGVFVVELDPDRATL